MSISSPQAAPSSSTSAATSVNSNSVRTLVLAPTLIAIAIVSFVDLSLLTCLTIVTVGIVFSYFLAMRHPLETALFSRWLPRTAPNVSYWQFAATVLLGPGILLLLSASAGYALHKFRSTLNPSAPNPTLATAKAVSLELRDAFPSLLTPERMNYALWASAVIWGTVLYGAITHKAFAELYETLAGNAEPAFMRDYREEKSTPVPEVIAKNLWSRMNPNQTISSSFLDTLTKSIDRVLHEQRGTSASAKLPALRLAAELMTSNSKCTGSHCPIEVALAQILVGVPAATDNTLECWLKNATGQTSDMLCQGDIPLWWDPLGLAGFGEAAASPKDVAESIFTPERCNQDGLECQAVISLMQMGLNDSSVRSKITYEVGFIYGWGRLIVAILFFGALNALLYRRCARTPLTSQSTWVMTKTNTMVLNPPSDVIARGNAAEELTQTADNEQIFKNLLEADLKNPQSATSGADPRLHPIVAALHASLLGVRSKNADALQASEEVAFAELDRWRENFTSLITLFPVIGFSATLLGLIAALGVADKIAVNSEVARAAAIREMVGLLSSCFATTFLALLCMALFALVSQRQGYAERLMIGTVYARLKHVFRPTE